VGGTGQGEHVVIVKRSEENPTTLELHWKYDEVFIDHIKLLARQYRAWNKPNKSWDIPEHAYNMVAAHMRLKGYRLQGLFEDFGTHGAGGGGGGMPGASSSRPAGAAAGACAPATPAAAPATPAAAPPAAALPGRVAPAAVGAAAVVPNPNTGSSSSSRRSGVQVPLLPDAEVDQIIWNNVPMQLWDYLKPYQKEGVQYAVKRGGRMLLADVQGLGKTIQVGVVNDLMHGA
jgi:hypothetical protein